MPNLRFLGIKSKASPLGRGNEAPGGKRSSFLKISIDDKSAHPNDIEAAEKLIAAVSQRISYGKDLVEVIQIRFEVILPCYLLAMEVKVILVTPLLKDRLEAKCALKPDKHRDEPYQGSFSDFGLEKRACDVVNEIKAQIRAAIEYEKEEVQDLENILQGI